ncbi:MAG: carboxypeptidase regulatory-like domain-containing protein, partial [Candidatus Hodarchaeales archaeon]
MRKKICLALCALFLINIVGFNSNITLFGSGTSDVAGIELSNLENSPIQEKAVQTTPIVTDYDMNEVTYNWYDAKTNGHHLPLEGDDQSTLIYMPFPFTLYDQTFQTLYISSNGWLSFGDTNPTQYSNPNFPSDHDYAIAPFWDDLRAENNLYAWLDNDFLVIQYDNFNHLSDDLAGTFQVVFFPDNSLLFQYEWIENDKGAAVGINYGMNQMSTQFEDGLDLASEFALLFDRTDFVAITSDILLFDTTSLNLAWTGVSLDLITGFEVFVDGISHTTTTATTTTTLISGLTSGNTYEITVVMQTSVDSYNVIAFVHVFDPFYDLIDISGDVRDLFADWDITGAEIILSNSTHSFTEYSSDYGYFYFYDLYPSNYVAVINAPNYKSASYLISLSVGAYSFYLNVRLEPINYVLVDSPWYGVEGVPYHFTWYSDTNGSINFFEVFVDGVSQGTTNNHYMDISGLAPGYYYYLTVEMNSTVGLYSDSLSVDIYYLDEFYGWIELWVFDDRNGNPIPGATVVLSNDTTTFTGTTNENGFYNATNLWPDQSYNVYAYANDYHDSYDRNIYVYMGEGRYDELHLQPVNFVDIHSPETFPEGFEYNLNWWAEVNGTIYDFEVFVDGVSRGTTNFYDFEIGSFTLGTYNLTVVMDTSLGLYQDSILLEIIPIEEYLGWIEIWVNTPTYDYGYSDPIPNARVEVYNETWSTTGYTDINGLYNVTGLWPDMYYQIEIFADGYFPYYTGSYVYPGEGNDRYCTLNPIDTYVYIVSDDVLFEDTTYLLEWIGLVDETLINYEVFIDGVSLGTTTDRFMIISGLDFGTYEIEVVAYTTVDNYYDYLTLQVVGISFIEPLNGSTIEGGLVYIELETTEYYFDRVYIYVNGEQLLGDYDYGYYLDCHCFFVPVFENGSNIITIEFYDYSFGYREYNFQINSINVIPLVDVAVGDYYALRVHQQQGEYSEYSYMDYYFEFIEWVSTNEMNVSTTIVSLDEYNVTGEIIEGWMIVNILNGYIAEVSQSTDLEYWEGGQLSFIFSG